MSVCYVGVGDVKGKCVDDAACHMVWDTVYSVGNGVIGGQGEGWGLCTGDGVDQLCNGVDSGIGKKDGGGMCRQGGCELCTHGFFVRACELVTPDAVVAEIVGKR